MNIPRRQVSRLPTLAQKSDTATARHSEPHEGDIPQGEAIILAEAQHWGQMQQTQSG